MMAPKEKAINRTWSRRSDEMCEMDSLTTSNFPVTNVIVNRSMAPTIIHTMPMKPFSAPAANDETAVPNGMCITNTLITNAAKTPHSAARGAEIPSCRCPCASRCGYNAMKYSRVTIGIAAARIDRTGLPRGS